MAKSLVQEFTKGLWNEIPPFRLVLGLCPALAVTTSMENGLGMGAATTAVLVCSNILVSLFRKIIPPKVRIACFIIIIATFVTAVSLLMQAYTYGLFQKLGIFIPLIVVNCVVLGRSEAFAFKRGIFVSMLDGLGIGIGFTLALGALGGVREILGKGTLTLWSDLSWGNPLFAFGDWYQPFSIMVEAPGAFIGLGMMLCLMNAMGNK